MPEVPGQLVWRGVDKAVQWQFAPAAPGINRKFIHRELQRIVNQRFSGRRILSTFSEACSNRLHGVWMACPRMT
jgi:hypothetical protein